MRPSLFSGGQLVDGCSCPDPHHGPNLKLTPARKMFSLKLTMEPAAPPQLPTVVQAPFGTSTKRYSILAVQFCATAYSSPAPTAHPVSTELSKVDGGLRPVWILPKAAPAVP